MSKATRDQFAQDVYDQRLLEQDALSPLNWPGSTSPYTRLFASAAYTDFEAMENRIVDTSPRRADPGQPGRLAVGGDVVPGSVHPGLETSAGRTTPRAPPTSATSSCSG